MEFVRCPSDFSPLTVGMSLMTKNLYSVFLSICLIPAKRISGSFLNYIALLVLLHLSNNVVFVMLHYTQYGSTSESEVVKQLRKQHFKYPQIVFIGFCICCSCFGEKVLSGWRMNGRKEIVVSQLTTKIPLQIYRITNRTHLVTLRHAKSYSLWSQYLHSRSTLQLAITVYTYL